MTIRVLVPSQLHSYTGGASRLEAPVGAICEVLDDLDRRFPGLKFPQLHAIKLTYTRDG